MDSLISINNIVIDLNVREKNEVLKYISELVSNLGISNNEEEVLNDLKKREDIGSTNLGECIALPHIKSKYILKPTIIIISLKDSIYWDSSDVDVVISILIPSDFEVKKYLKLISNLSRKLVDNQFKHKLIRTKNKKEILNLIKSAIYKEE